MHRVRRLTLLAGIALAAVVTNVAAATLSDDIRIESKVLDYALQYRVYVPDGAPGQALRTLYATDGAWYLEQGQMKAVLDEMIAAGRIEPVLVVFVGARDPDRLETNRRNPTSRTILELSFGGLNAACFGLSIPHVFSNLAMQSPASGEMLRIVADEYRRNDRLPLRIFLSVGTRNDNTDDGRRFRRTLEDKGYPVTYFEVSQGHNWNNWGPLLPEVLLTFYGRH